MKHQYPKKMILRKRRSLRVRAKVRGTEERPRLSVFRSNMHFYAQLIDDVAATTIASASDMDPKAKGMPKTSKGRAAFVGKEIAKKALGKNIRRVVFDRGGYAYAGVVKILADAAREEGLQF